MASWPRGDKRCTRHATGGSGDATGAQRDVIPEVCAVAAGPGGLERERGGHAESHVVDAGGLFALDDRGERPALAIGGARWEVGSGARCCALLTQAASVEARCIRKAPSEPLIRGTTGGEVRCSCLSPRSGRVLRRPPVVSSAGESSAKPTTGEAGSPFLPAARRNIKQETDRWSPSTNSLWMHACSQNTARPVADPCLTSAGD